ncbi:MAG: DinB family protein [Acidiferrobacteraceae bacterium]
MSSHFATMAEYNGWANVRLYGMASQLTDEQYRRDVGVYFKSLHGTLNHLLAADRIWMHRLTGVGDHPNTLNAIRCDDLPSLSVAREQEDHRIVRFVESLSSAQLEEVCEYRTLNGTPQRQRRREILAHLFNHQTHHRGQAHAVLTILGLTEPDPLDLLIMQRERGSVTGAV